MTQYFDVEHFNLLPILIFAIIITMFGCYVIQIHYLMEHHRVERALRLMFSHYFIVIAVNLMTIGIHMLYQVNEIPIFIPIMMIVAEAVFYIAIAANHTYYKTGISLEKSDLYVLGAIQCIGFFVVVLGRSSIYGIMIGILLIALGNFVVFLRKYSMIN